MTRRRRRKKRRQREREAQQQVELLANGDEGAIDAAEEPLETKAEAAPPVGDGAKGSPSDAGAEAAEPPATAAESPAVSGEIEAPPADRWAHAVGRRLPARGSHSDGQRTGAAAVRGGQGGHDVHESARDHAAARGRTHGEPLARAKELVQQGRVDEAIELYLGILTVNPGNLKAHHNLGVLFDELHQYEDALEHFAAAERIAPESVEVLTNYASALTSVARYDQAEAILSRAQRLDGESPLVRTAVGVLYFRRGLYTQAEAELRWVCSRDRDNGPAFYYRGEALNRLGRFDEAGQAMERAKVLLPNDPRPFYTLGHLYDRKHQAEEAAEMYRHARRLQKR